MSSRHLGSELGTAPARNSTSRAAFGADSHRTLTRAATSSIPVAGDACRERVEPGDPGRTLIGLTGAGYFC